MLKLTITGNRLRGGCSTVPVYLARGEDIFPVPGEGDGADLVPVVSLEEGGDTPVGHRVPDLDAAVHGTRHKMLSVIRPSRK